MVAVVTTRVRLWFIGDRILQRTKPVPSFRRGQRYWGWRGSRYREHHAESMGIVHENLFRVDNVSRNRFLRSSFQDFICGSSCGTDLITRNQRLCDRISFKVTQPSLLVEHVHMIHRHIYWKIVSSLYNCICYPL